MQLAQLYYYSSLCKNGSFTKTSRIIHISQPSLSKSIKELENEIGFTLLVRSPGGILPTEEGKQFLMYCDRVLKEVESLKGFVESVNEEAITLRLGMPPIFGIAYIPEIEKYVQHSSLKINIQWEEGSSEKLYGMLKAHEIDAAILPEKLVPMTGIKRKTFRYIEEEVVVSCGHALSKETAVSLRELKNESFAFFSSDTGQQLLLKDLFKNAGFYPKKQHDSTQLPTILKMVENGDLIAILHNNALDMYTGKLNVCNIPFDPPYVLKLVLAWTESGEKEKLIQMLSSSICEEPYKYLRESTCTFIKKCI